jgi:hypothetical protein
MIGRRLDVSIGLILMVFAARVLADIVQQRGELVYGAETKRSAI